MGSSHAAGWAGTEDAKYESKLNDTHGQHCSDSLDHCKSAVSTMLACQCVVSDQIRFGDTPGEIRPGTVDIHAEGEIPMRDFASEYLHHTSRGDRAQALHWSDRAKVKEESTLEPSEELLDDGCTFHDYEDKDVPLYVDDDGSEFVLSQTNWVQANTQHQGHSRRVSDENSKFKDRFPEPPYMSLHKAVDPFCITPSVPDQATSSSMENFCFVPSIPGCDMSRLEGSCLNQLQNHCLGPAPGFQQGFTRNERGLHLIHADDNA
jgi:hypothetical protein